jgi:undecaprenyl-diphosphatase
MFSIAFFIGLVNRNLKLFIFLFSLASIIGFSRIYLGVHFPLDIVGGMLWAIIVSLLTFKLLSIKIDETIQ